MNKYETPVNELDLCSGMCIHEFEICSTWPDVLVKTLQVIWGMYGVDSTSFCLAGQFGAGFEL